MKRRLADHYRFQMCQYHKIRKVLQQRFIISLDKPCFQHDRAYGDSKDLTRKIIFDKIMSDKAFNITKNPKDEEYEM